MHRCLVHSPVLIASLVTVAALSGCGDRPAAAPTVRATSLAPLDDTGDVAAARQQATSTSTSTTAVTTTTNASPSTTAVAPRPTNSVPPMTTAAPPVTVEPTTTVAPPTTLASPPTTTLAPPMSLPAAGQNGPGHFSGRILRDDQPLSNVTLKVVNIHTPGWPRLDVLDTLGGHDGVDVFVTTTDVNGNWSVSGLSAGKQFMLKVFPPSLCDAYGEIAAAYTSAESGFINTNGNPFMSTRLAPGPDTYNVWSVGRYLFDMPVHVYPVVGGALHGNEGYSDLNIRFSTRTGSFNTSLGVRSGCTSTASGGTSAVIAKTHRRFGAGIARREVPARPQGIDRASFEFAQ